MKLKADFQKHVLNFRFDAGTSRGVLRQKDTWYLHVSASGLTGRGECGPLKGLSIDDREDFEVKLREVCQRMEGMDLKDMDQDLSAFFKLQEFPSILFGLETALLDLKNGGKMLLFDSDFSKGIGSIPINGLVWMGEKEFMQQQIAEKIGEGYACIKMKIGAIDFETECTILRELRKKYSPEQLSLRLDANGAFSADEALDKLEILAGFGIHSIEQPIRQGQMDSMRELCQRSPLKIALDEELIGISSYVEKKKLLETIRPPFIILKPSLLGGFKACREWIEIAGGLNIGWWITSALESNIGLNAIAQFTASFSPSIPQGLGTGKLYHNNIESPLVITKGSLRCDPLSKWDFKLSG
ncbi:MAG: o-succinylbenzoate synthase [Cytophagaceae bacterium]